jgi:hypothetical protein
LRDSPRLTIAAGKHQGQQGDHQSPVHSDSSSPLYMNALASVDVTPMRTPRQMLAGASPA